MYKMQNFRQSIGHVAEIENQDTFEKFKSFRGFMKSASTAKQMISSYFHHFLPISHLVFVALFPRLHCYTRKSKHADLYVFHPSFPNY